MTSNYAELTESFEARDLDARSFRHADHIGVAYEMLRRYPFMQAAVKYGENIHAIATRAGAPDKFNTTITFAFMSLIAERMATTGHAGHDDFIARNPDLLAKDILDQWYSPPRLHSVLARRVFLMPDGLR